MQKIKKILNLIWDEFIYGSHFISLAGASTVIIGAELLKIKVTWVFTLLTYLIVQIGFYYNRYREFHEDFLTNPERTQHIKKYLKYLPFIISFYIIVFISLLICSGRLPAILFGLFALINVLLYTEISKRLTKRIIAFKEIYFAGCWTALSIFLVLFYSFPLNLSLLLYLFFIFLRIFLGTTLFDIKDIESDGRKKILTLPILLGKKKTFNFLRLLSILALIPIIIGFSLRLFPKCSLMLLLTMPYTFYYLKKSESKDISHIFLHYFLVGGEFNFYLLFVLIGKYFLQ